MFYLQLDWDIIKDEDITSFSSHGSHTPESNLQGQQTLAEDIRLDKMHPIISDAAMSDVVTPPTVNIISPSEDLLVTIATTTTVESAQTTTAKDNQSDSDFSEVKLDSMHPIISDAIKTDDVVTTTTGDTDDLMKSTSDELMSALEELNTVIGTSHTSSVGVVADHVTHTIKDSSHGSSDHINISDTGNYDRGSHGSSRQSNHSNVNIGSRSSSRQSNTGSHDNRNGTVNSEDGHKQKPPPAESARALYGFSAQSVR